MPNEITDRPTSRTPPKAVRETLRKEVNFGCPIADCGVPYLTWHHFDPPWRETHHHNPAGMIALCQSHAGLADGDRWTADQLREMKRNPFVKEQNINAIYDYLRKDAVFQFGNVAYNVPNILMIESFPVIFFRKGADGFDRLNLYIIDRNYNPLLVMEDNLWTAFQSNLFDLSCSTRGRDLKIWSDDGETSFSLSFKNISNSKFRSLISGNPGADKLLQEMNNPDSIPMWSVKGSLAWGQVKMEITDSQVTLTTPMTNVFSRNLVSNSQTCFQVGA